MDTLIDAPVAAEPRQGWESAIPAETWEIIRTRYVRGERLTVLTAEFGLNYETVVGRSSKHGWAELRREHERQSRIAAATPLVELENRATIERAIGPTDQYFRQIELYRESGGKLQREYDRVERLLDDDDLSNQDRVALTTTLIRLHERLQVALSIPSVKPVELRQSGSERRVAAVPVG